MSIQTIEADLADIRVAPDLTLKEKLQIVIHTTHTLEVTNETSFKEMTSIYAESKDWEKRIEFLRKQANAPDQERINARNDKAKDLLSPLKEIQHLAKQKCEQYQLLLVNQKKEEEERARRAADLIGLNDLPYIAPVENSTRGDGAIMYTRTVRKFRIVDVNKVPFKYFQLNSEMIERDIKLGVAEIPGLEIYDENITQLRTR